MDKWQIWIDTGGTFTDCIAVDPLGKLHKTKVLSSSALRGTVQEWYDGCTVKVRQDWNAPDDFIREFRFNLLGGSGETTEVASFDAEESLITFSESWSGATDKEVSFEVTTDLEAPVLAARLVTRSHHDVPLPPLDLRLATTRATNALLEHTGMPPHLFITHGFKDLPEIGDQRRPDLFALKIDKPPLLNATVVEVRKRMTAEGVPLKKLDRKALQESLSALPGPPVNAAVCLMHSYKNGSHEEEVTNTLREAGYRYVSTSSRLSSFIKIVPRTETAVVNAYLTPVLQEYIDSIQKDIDAGSFRMMTSAGGLLPVHRFTPKDSLLSGPAGGVVGAVAAGKKAGFNHIISFDMGGTSTDVSRYSNRYDYAFEHRVGGARLAAPALSIETVAAGGGSICSFDGFKLTVGPGSAGADPGPACYGAGGPLTLTDVNLLLGRIDLENFGIPVIRKAAEKKLDEILHQVGKSDSNRPDQRQILEGFLDIANERMADAIRKISLRKGYNPSDFALVAFGGAGAQHVCAIAAQLDIRQVVVPVDAGLLSARGLGHAVIEQFAEEQVLLPLLEVKAELGQLLNKLEDRAVEKLLDEEIDRNEIEIRRRLIFMRLSGQESTIEVNPGEGRDPEELFKEQYRKLYGHWISNRAIEVESIRVVASTRPATAGPPSEIRSDGTGTQPDRVRRVTFSGEEMETPVYKRSTFIQGQRIKGPALILDPYSTIVVEPGWAGELQTGGSLLLTRTEEPGSGGRRQQPGAVALELFTNRFTSIAEEMGEMLRRTALSVNVKERLDFSCALLSVKGELIVNAPHIPVHLGALGVCVRRLKEALEINPGDVLITNHPGWGGSHLPDVTVVTPIFTPEHELVAFAASRAHHAEIGGTRPGSMPPDATSLEEEGVVIPPMYLVNGGEEQWDKIRDKFTRGRYPSRNVEENIADLQAAVAANQKGVLSLLTLIEKYGKESVLHYMGALKELATEKMKATIRNLPNGKYLSEERLDDGTPLKVSIAVSDEQIVFDFEGTGGVHPGNLNATPAIVNSVVIYVLRLLVNEPLPLNEGLLEPVKIILPRSLLNPGFPAEPEQCPAVVGGNVETSQRLTDLLLKPFQRIACSQGTMNNVLFGNDRFGYYETVGGGTGAGSDFDGSSAVHHHMTNTAGTDPEILEQRYPVRLDRYEIRPGSGGDGSFRGGNGIIREMTFLEPVSLSVLSQHRVEAPYGIKDGKPGKKGEQWVVRKNGSKEKLNSSDSRELEAGDRFILHTPGGGGYGKIKNEKF